MSLFVLICMQILFLSGAGHANSKPPESRIIPLHYPALYPESIAWDDGLGCFISGSMALGSLFSITENGTVEEFIQDIDYSRITATLGVTIDSHRQRILTVINNVFDNPSGFHGVACYDLNSKARLFLAKFDKQAWPNDITVDRISGFAFVTDSANDVIYKVSQSGEASEFVKDPLFKSQSIVAVDPAAVRSGLNGITFAEDYLLVIQSNSGKLFKVTLHDHHVHVVDMDECLVAADGISMRKDGLLIVVSTDMLWLVKSRDHWDSAFVVQEVPLDRSFNATSVTFRDPKKFSLLVIQTMIQSG